MILETMSAGDNRALHLGPSGGSEMGLPCRWKIWEQHAVTPHLG